MLDESFIANKADEARKRANQSFPIDPILIAAAFGVQVFSAPLPPNVSGQVFYTEQKIFIEQTDFITRQRFSVAHELGHFILHNDGTSHTSFRDTISSQGTDTKEMEANSFAANLLMPKDEVMRLVDAKILTIDSMASYFFVSPIAMEYRIKVLGVVAYV